MGDVNLLYGKPLVKPANLETELEKIRTAAAQDDVRKEVAKGGTPSARAKATLSNFIIINLIGNKESEQEIDQLIDHISYAYPSRFFVVDSELKSGAIATSASSRCFLAGSGAHFCSEEVFVSASAEGIKLVPNLLLSLLAPDVANIVLLVLPKGFFKINHLQKDLLNRIFKFSNKVIFDSRGLSNLSQVLVDLSELKRSGICDLNWRRSRKLRNLLREVFDAEVLNNSAKSINKISIDCIAASEELASSVIPATAVLLGSWLLSSLEQKVVSKIKKVKGAEVIFVCQGKKGNLDLIISSSSDSAKSEAGLDIAALKINFADSKLEGMLSIKLDQKKQIAEVMTQFGGADQPINTRTVPLAIPKFEDLLLHEVIVSIEDEGYIRTCSTALELSKLS